MEVDGAERRRHKDNDDHDDDDGVRNMKSAQWCVGGEDAAGTVLWRRGRHGGGEET